MTIFSFSIGLIHETIIKWDQLSNINGMKIPYENAIAEVRQGGRKSVIQILQKMIENDPTMKVERDRDLSQTLLDFATNPSSRRS
jgi:hypothetical protein